MGKHDKPDKGEEKEEKPTFAFKYCKTKCFACKECGWFKATEVDGATQWHPHVWVPSAKENLFTAEMVRESLIYKQPKYYAKLAVGQPSTWVPDERTKELFYLSQWVMDILILKNCPHDARISQQRFFNRKARATEDLYELAAITVNNFLTGNIDQYKGRG